ncbi:MAG: 50S ribosomal protein L10 [Candidatus Omnitrophota bacterium]
MKKIGLVIKGEAERLLKDKIQGIDSFILVQHSGLSAADLNVLRMSLVNLNSSLAVIKNSVGKRLLKSYQDLSSLITGPCGLIFINKDLISTSRLIAEFKKDKPGLIVKAGFLKDRIISEEEIVTLSKIQSLAALHSRIVGGLKSPIFSIAFSLKQILNKLVWALGKIKDKKQ